MTKVYHENAAKQTDFLDSPGHSPLTRSDLEDLVRAFVTEELATEAKLFKVNPDAARLLAPKPKLDRHNYEGMGIPYLTPATNYARTYRIRLKFPKIDHKGKITQKYDQTFKTKNNIYFPPNCKTEWLSDLSISVIIVEGEKKCLALWRAAWYGRNRKTDKPKFLPIAIPGVNSWKSKTGKKIVNDRGEEKDESLPLADFNFSGGTAESLWKWEGRKVYILFDSNVFTNVNVMWARRRLGEFLTNDLKANVLFVDLPETKDCNGIDDVLGKIEREQNTDAAIKYLDDLLNKSTSEDSTYETCTTGFKLSAKGVWAVDESGDLTFICKPLEILARTRDVGSKNQGRLLQWKDLDGIVHTWAMPNKLLAGDSNQHIEFLLDSGFILEPTRNAKQKLSKYILSSEPKTVRICVDKIGWQNSLYILPDQTIGQQTANNQVIFQAASSIDHPYNQAGTLQEWRENVAQHCVGNSRLVFAVSVAFAAALLSPLKQGGGGFHFRGGSSTGKTTALLCAGSVWGGNDKKGFVKPWRTTSNGLEAVAELQNDSLLCLDELKECNPRTASEVAYMLANGQDKGRMSRNLYARKSKNWTLLFLSSGELSLEDLLTQEGQRTYGGQEVRMVDLPADAGKDFGLFEKLHGFESGEQMSSFLTEASKEYRGTAIIAFLEGITEIGAIDLLKNNWEAFSKKFVNSVLNEGCSFEAGRVAKRFALTAFAGWMASEICGWEEDEAEKACKKVFGDWNNSRSKGQSDIEKAIRQVRKFIQEHGASRFQNLDATTERVINRAGFKQIDNTTDEIEYLIFPETFRQEICKGYDSGTVARELQSRNCLKTDSGRMTKQVRIEKEKQRFYIINQGIYKDE